MYDDDYWHFNLEILKEKQKSNQIHKLNKIEQRNLKMREKMKPNLKRETSLK